MQGVYMNMVDYYLDLQELGLPEHLIDLAMEMPGYSVPHETILCLLRYSIQVKCHCKTEALYRLARLVALLDARRNAMISEDDIDEVFTRLFKKLSLD
jgi:hypothetical protein